jgi:uncharacterized protein (TIGR00369 family)
MSDAPTQRRERLVDWDDPTALAQAGRTMAGRAFLQAMVAGALPPPPICRLVGFGLEAIEHDRVTMVMQPDESHYNPIGSVHGGIVATLLDSVMGCAVHNQLPAGRGYTTLEIKVNYLRAIGRVVHLGRQTATAEASLVDATQRLLAHSTTTCLIFDTPQ